MDIRTLNRKVIQNAMRDNIDLNNATITIDVFPTKDNGFGKMIPDYDETPETVTYSNARITKFINVPAQSLTGMGVSESYYIIATHDADWLEAQMFIQYDGRVFETDIPEVRTGFGGDVYKIARLMDRLERGYPHGKS